MNLSDIAILNIKGSDYRCFISLISKNEAINLMQNADLTEKNWNIIKNKNLLSHIKMSKEILTFVYIEIEKSKFYQNKIPAHLREIDIENVLVSNKIFFGKKKYDYLIGYLHNDHKAKPCYIMLPKTSAYVKRYHGETNNIILIGIKSVLI